MSLIISERIGAWSISPLRGFRNLKVDRSDKTVFEYLQERDVIWKENDRNCDITLYTNMERLPGHNKYISIIGEPRHLCSGAYNIARHEHTMAVAPGNNIRRFVYGQRWRDPMFENWSKRKDEILLIGFPYPERVSFVSDLITRGVKIDVYGRSRWPIPQYKGVAPKEGEISPLYKYKIVIENSKEFKYHSEKLYNGFSYGCITFYDCDKDLASDLPFINNVSIPLTFENILNRGDFVKKIMEGIGDFMFTDKWEICSFKKEYDRIIELALEIKNGRSN